MYISGKPQEPFEAWSPCYKGHGTIETWVWAPAWQMKPSWSISLNNGLAGAYLPGVSVITGHFLHHTFSLCAILSCKFWSSLGLERANHVHRSASKLCWRNRAAKLRAHVDRHAWHEMLRGNDNSDSGLSACCAKSLVHVTIYTSLLGAAILTLLCSLLRLLLGLNLNSKIKGRQTSDSDVPTCSTHFVSAWADQ